MDSPTYEGGDGENASPFIYSESMGSAAIGLDATNLESFGVRDERSSPVEQAQIESAPVTSAINPSPATQEIDPRTPEPSYASLLGSDHSILSASILLNEGKPSPLPETKEVPKTLQDELGKTGSLKFEASSPADISYAFDEIMQDEPGEENSLSKANEFSSPPAFESKSVDEERSPSLPASKTISQEAEETEKNKSGNEDQNAHTSPIKQTIIIDLGSSSDVEDVSENAAPGIALFSQSSFPRPVKEHRTSITSLQSKGEVRPVDNKDESGDEVGNGVDAEEDTAMPYPKDETVGETKVTNLHDFRSRPLTPDASQQPASALQRIPEDESLNQASTKVFPPTPRLTQPSQGLSQPISSQSSAPQATKRKMPARRSARLSSTPEAAIQEAQLSSPSSQKPQTPIRRSARRLSSSTPQTRPQTPEMDLTSSISPPSTKKTPTRRSQRLSPSPSQAMHDHFDNGLSASPASTSTTAIAAAETTPTRRSQRVRQRQHHRLSDVPEALSPWFGPRRSREAQAQAEAKTPATAHIPSGAVMTENGELVIPDSEETGTSITMSSPSFSHETFERETTPKANGTIKDPPAPASSTRTRTPRSSQPALSQASNLGIRTKHAYYTPLSALASLLNSSPPASASVLALASTSSTAPERAKTGPKDWYTAFAITDHLCHPSHVSVRVFRPYKTALPVVALGDPVLLRGFTVKGRRAAAELVSGEASGWCVWPEMGRAMGETRTSPRRAGKGKGKGSVWVRKENEMGFKVWEMEVDDESGHEEISGPPVEFGDEERRVARALREWWQEEGLSDSRGKDGETIADEEKGTGGKIVEKKKMKGTKGNKSVVHELRDGLKYRDEA